MSRATRAVVAGILLGTVACGGAAGRTLPAAKQASSSLAPLGPPPARLRDALDLSPRHTKYLDAGGVPVLASAQVDDVALREARYLILRMIGHRPDVLRAIAEQHVRFVVMAPDEMTTDVPEHADLIPKRYWDRRARGLGATTVRPATSCGEENLLELAGDPYATENILVHEFAHTVHRMGMEKVDPTFGRRLEATFQHAIARGLWKGTYAASNVDEYWAEATQSWFDTNRVNDAEHGPVDTREKLVRHDPEIAALLREAYGDGPWRYVKPSLRPPEERAHLAGLDRSRTRQFRWPADPEGAGTGAPPSASAAATGVPLALRDAGSLPSRSPASVTTTTLVVTNHRQDAVLLEWLDFEGARRPYGVLRAGSSVSQQTYVGHVWIASARGRVLGGAAAPAGEGHLELR